MRKPIEQRIRQLQEQKKALQSRLGKQQRAETTRRKMLLGSFLLERLEEDGDRFPFNDRDGQPNLRQWLVREFAAYLGRDADRLLFVDLLWPQNDPNVSPQPAHGTRLDDAGMDAAATLRDGGQRSTSEDGGTVQS